MKKILLFLFAILWSSSYAQLDREHWFAPMFDGQSNSDDEQFLHLSTNETTPFNVNIYSNNVLVAQKMISKGNPGVITIDRNPGANQINRENIITAEVSELHKVITKGLYVKADKPCFANLRFGVTNHTEIITSKGTAGIGTKFYTVVAPNAQDNNSNLGFAASFIATENNTNVTVSKFKKPLFFTNYGAATSFTFTLNKGESYIIDGRMYTPENQDGFIGAEVNSDKPISMTNGNFNGQYASAAVADGSDILMDQSVPVDKLGAEFVIVKGYGAIGNNMEGAIVVATEPNTAVYLNDSTTPAAILVNPGDYFQIKESSYVDRGNQHFNLHIISDKNVYVYQLLAGVEFGTAPLATGGMNYIPPLNCYLPKKIDEISYINYLSNVPHYPPFSTKLNIITEKNAVIKVNGVIPNLTTGPYDISVNAISQKWVSYSIPNVTGNITVESTKAVTAGIASGNAAFGYGGYFAGFSSIPLITKTNGDCLPGVRLEVTEGFEFYEWLIKNAAGTYDPAPGVNNLFYYEPTQAGIYAVRVKQGSCPEIQTRDFKFYNCTTFTNYNYDTCTWQIITPQFALSSQSINIPTIVIDTPPTKGTVVVNPDGTLTYTANPNATGTDTFKFSFCGNGTIPDCETVQATIHLNQIEKYDMVLYSCSATGTATYDLTSAAISPDATVVKKYFSDAAFTTQIPVGELTNYTSSPGFVYVQLSNTFGCSATATIELKIKAPPVVTPALYTVTTCDEEIDGIIDGNYKVDLTTITPTIVQNPANFTTRYFTTQAKALSGLPADAITGNFVFTANTSVWIRVDSSNTCPPVIKEVFLKTGVKFSINNLASAEVCDDNLNATENIMLSDYLPMFTVDGSTTVKYFATLFNAQNNTGFVRDAQTITGTQTFYYRFTKAGFCDVIGTLNMVMNPSTPTALLNSYTVCEGESVTLTAENSPVYTAWLWKKGAETVSTTSTATLTAGFYTVYFTNPSGCIFEKQITIAETPKAVFNIAAYNATHCDDNFDGAIKIKLNEVTPVILANSNLYTVEYSVNSNFLPILSDEFSYSANTKVYVRAVSTLCPTVFSEIDFKVGNNLPIIKTTSTVKVCDDDFDGVKSVNLSSYVSEFTTDSTVNILYFNNLTDAEDSSNPISDIVSVTNSGIYYLRFHKNSFCDVIVKLTINIQKAKKSDVLADQEICPNATTLLDAGSGFDAYLWSTGEKTPTIIVPVGEYWVDLTSNSCTYRQKVSVKAVALPQITSVDIKGSTVTLNVTGGNLPYQYAIDGSNYQTSNVFTNIKDGDHTVYVISADNCDPISADINLIEIFNAITPNGDGINDVLNYSGLLQKEEPFLQIFDRYGKTVFKGDQNNRFSWDGKSFGKAVNTGSYWYSMKWKEPGFSTFTEYSGWVLVKNRK